MKLLLVAALLATAGCAGMEKSSTGLGDGFMTIPHYRVAAENQRIISMRPPTKVSLGTFTQPEQIDDICRATGKVVPPDYTDFATYLRGAIASELKAASALDDQQGGVTVSGHIVSTEMATTRNLAGDFQVSTGYWRITLDLKSSAGQTLRIAHAREHQTAFIGDDACLNTAQAFLPFTQELVGKIFASPEFTKLKKQ